MVRRIPDSALFLPSTSPHQPTLPSKQHTSIHRSTRKMESQSVNPVPSGGPGSGSNAGKLQVSSSVGPAGNVTKRLQSELMGLMMNATPGVSAFPDNDSNMLHWTGTIVGPQDTPYAGIVYKMTLDFPADYPLSPPLIKFTSPVWHPNVDMSGNICLDILKEKWSAVYNVTSILLSLQSLLNNPNNASPLNAQAAELWDSDPKEYKRLLIKRYNSTE